MGMSKLLSSILAGAVSAIFYAGMVEAAEVDLPQTHLKVVGGSSTLNRYKYVQQPFWSETLSKNSNGKVTADVSGDNELGLKGPEVLRLLRLGVFDVASATISYMAGDEPAFEGLDLPGLTNDIDVARKAADAYAPVLGRIMEEEYNSKLLSFSAVTMQVLFCRKPIKKLTDIKGLKVRTFNSSSAAYVEALGAASVNIPFIEVIPALQRGVIDCGITGAATGNASRWWETTTDLFTLPLGWSMTFFALNLDTWKRMDPSVQTFFMEQMKILDDGLWAQARSDVDDGIACNTGQASCKNGVLANPAMSLTTPSAEDLALHAKILSEVVIPEWAKRCGADCVGAWNATIGNVLGLTASAK